MNKSNLIDALSTKENLTENNAFEIINLIFDGFTDVLKKGGRIKIRGFGVFTVREYGGYTEGIQRLVLRQRWERRSCRFSRWERN